MSEIGRLWAGKLFGTNTGNLAATFDSSEDGFSGTIRFMDDQFGPVVYEVKGTFDGSVAEFTGKATQHAPNIVTGDITGRGALTPEGNLRGEWSSTLGTGGTFQLFPHDPPKTPARNPVLPEQVQVATRTLGALRLYADDVEELFEFMKRDFASDQGLIITYNERGSQISKYSRDFLKEYRHLGELRYIKVQIQEPDAYGINRLAVVELNAVGTNEVRVQGIQESWVVGKAESIASHLKTKEKSFATSFRRFGVNINVVIFFVALALLPELPLLRRFVFMLLLVGVFASVVQLHAKYIPNVAIYLSDRTPGMFVRAWPQILSWVIAATSAFVAAVAYGLLSGQLPKLFP